MLVQCNNCNRRHFEGSNAQRSCQAAKQEVKPSSSISSSPKLQNSTGHSHKETQSKREGDPGLAAILDSKAHEDKLRQAFEDKDIVQWGITGTPYIKSIDTNTDEMSVRIGLGIAGDLHEEGSITAYYPRVTEDPDQLEAYGMDELDEGITGGEAHGIIGSAGLEEYDLEIEGIQNMTAEERVDATHNWIVSSISNLTDERWYMKWGKGIGLGQYRKKQGSN